MKNFRYFALALLVMLAPVCVGAQDDAEALNRMKEYVTNMAFYSKNFTQEKVYLHIDNNGYIPGEKLWFKAYVVQASTLTPCNMSKVLHVEMLNPDGEIIDTKQLPIYNGRTYGDFYLDPMLYHSGYYEIRAYTRAMLNWDKAYIFSRVLPLFEQPRDSVNFTDLKMEYPEYQKKDSEYNRGRPQPLVTEATQKVKDAMVTFYPEGGYITQGLATRVAFKLTDKTGLPLDQELHICGNDGKEVATARVVHDGMGFFDLPESWSGGYALLKGDKEIRFNLPEARPRGVDVHATCSADKGLDIKIRSTEAYSSKKVGVSVTCRGQLCYLNTFVPSGETDYNVPYDQLKDGILQVTIFTDMGEVLSERLVWCEPHTKAPQMTIRQNKEVYEPFQPVVLDISLNDAEGNPLQGDFSLSVKDADVEFGTDGCNLLTDMLLASDLKGYIHNPDYYFEASDTDHHQALDALLMVQGWRRYSWKEMAGLDTFQLKHPVEDGLLLYGGMTQTKDALKNLSKDGKLNINFLVNMDKGTKLFSVDTDPNGKFALKLPNFNGDAPTIITVTNAKDSRIATDLKIDRNFSPSPTAYEPLSLAKEEKGVVLVQKKPLKKPETFEWQDTIPDLTEHIIEGVKVVGKRDLGYEPSFRSQWSGGEDASKQYARYYYNLRRELDIYQDKGEGVPCVWDWLQERNSNFFYEMETDSNGMPVYHLYYKNRKAVLIIDNDSRGDGKLSAIIDQGYLMHEFRSLMIVDNSTAVDKVISDGTMGTGTSTNNSVDDVTFSTIFLYTRRDIKQAPYYKKGTRWLTLYGYSKVDEFFSPDYRSMMLPTQSDHRRTLYWAPQLTTDSEGKSNVIFYSGSRPNERLHIQAQGITTTGQLFTK